MYYRLRQDYDPVWLDAANSLYDAVDMEYCEHELVDQVREISQGA